ncbi:MAG: nitrate- and nitrite sensing domain-containing protein, partial [Candidatus Sericytochromatia bacterium]
MKSKTKHNKLRIIMKIKTKILILSSIPILLLGTFSFNKIEERNSNISNLIVLKYYSNVLVKSSNLIHELQKERGYSSLFISNNGKKFKDKLDIQREITNKELVKLEEFLDKTKSDNTSLLKLSKSLKEYTPEIDNYRKLINNLNKTPEEAIKLYSDIIIKLFNYSKDLIVLNKSSNNELENLKISYIHLFHLKENMGKERAFVGSILSKNKIDKSKLLSLNSLIQKKKTHADLLNDFFNIEQKELYKKLEKSDTTSKIIEVEKLLTEKDKDFNIDPALWFKTATQNIEVLKDIDINLSNEILRKSDSIIEVESKNRFIDIIISFISIIISILISLVLIYQINKSIINLIKITNKVSEG